MKPKKLEPIGRINLVVLIRVLEKEIEIIECDINYISGFDFNGIEVFQFQAKDYLYNTKFINFELTKN